MAYPNEADDSPRALINLMRFIEYNTGLLGDSNPGDARFNIGGSTVMITSDRPSFDSHDILLKRIEEDENLKIKHISLKRSHRFDSPHPHINVVEA